MDIKLLRETVDNLFSKRGSVMSLMQEIGDNFYPERAEFTLRKDISDEFAGHLMTSYPVQVRRELADQTGAMLRPTAKQWFHGMVGEPDEKLDIDAKRWLEEKAKVMHRAMYDRHSLFSQANKQADHDYITFGQSPMSIRLNRNANGLIYQCWHIRDVVWIVDEDGEMSLVARKWKPQGVELQRLFQGKNHASLAGEVRQNPFGEVECRHFVVKSELYDMDARGKPFISIYYDVPHDHILEAVPVWTREYMIPRWQTVAGSQYALSPATITALPDARLIQAMAYTLLQAGEKIVNPPLIATENVVRSDVGIYAGGITWVDQDYDERLGEALRPMTIDAKGMPLSREMIMDTRQLLAQAFYLNKLTLPQRGPEMTAYEVGQRVQQYIRDALPLFEPMEYERNGAMCEMTFELMFRAGAFGSPFDIPKSLQGREIKWRFESPLHDAIEQQLGQKFIEAKDMIGQALAIDQTASVMMDAKIALREALEGIGTPATWIRGQSEVDQMVAQEAKTRNAQQTLAMMEQGANIAATQAKAAPVPAAA